MIKIALDMLDNTTYKLQQLFFEYTNCLIYAQNEELDRRIGTWHTGIITS